MGEGRELKAVEGGVEEGLAAEAGVEVDEESGEGWK